MADYSRLNAWLETIDVEDKGVCESTWPMPLSRPSREQSIVRMKIDANNGNRDAVESLRLLALAYLELISTTETRRRKIVRAIRESEGSK